MPIFRFGKNRRRPEEQLVRAIEQGDTERAFRLLENGADPNCTAGNYGRTPLHLAALASNARLTMELIRRGAKIDRPDKGGSRPLFMAASAGAARCAEILLDKGANVNAVNDQGWPALHIAIAAGKGTTAKLLIDRGAEVNLPCCDLTSGAGPLSALHLAVSRENVPILTALLNAGADYTVTDAQGLTPLQHARKLRHSETRNVLEEFVSLDHTAQIRRAQRHKKAGRPGPRLS